MRLPKTAAQSGFQRYNGNRFKRTASSDVGVVLLPEKRIRFGDFQLDYGSYQLCRRGIPVRLEGLPLQLLMFLVDHRGQLVTRDQIASELWSSKDVFVDVEQGINTAIRKIRRALCDDADEPHYLQTVVGRGYRFVTPTAEDDHPSPAPAAEFVFSPEDLGRAIMSAAGLDPENPQEPRSLHPQMGSSPNPDSASPVCKRQQSRRQLPRYRRLVILLGGATVH